MHSSRGPACRTCMMRLTAGFRTLNLALDMLAGWRECRRGPDDGGLSLLLLFYVLCKRRGRCLVLDQSAVGVGAGLGYQ